MVGSCDFESVFTTYKIISAANFEYDNDACKEIVCCSDLSSKIMSAPWLPLIGLLREGLKCSLIS